MKQHLGLTSAIKIGCIWCAVLVEEILYYLIINMYSSCPNLGYFI